MKGIETKIILAIILMLLIFLIIYMIVVQPSTRYAQQSGKEISFREFCFHWSVVGYPPRGYPYPDGNLKIEKYEYSISEYCNKAGTSDIETCIKICKGIV